MRGDDDAVAVGVDPVARPEGDARETDGHVDKPLIVGCRSARAGAQRLDAEIDLGNFIGIAKFSAPGAQLLVDQMEQMAAASRNDYYTVAVDRLAGRGEHIGYVDVAGRPWVEIDTVDDLERAYALVGAGERA